MENDISFCCHCNNVSMTMSVTEKKFVSHTVKQPDIEVVCPETI